MSSTSTCDIVRSIDGLHRLAGSAALAGDQTQQERGGHAERGEAVGVRDRHRRLRDPQRRRLHHLHVEVGTVGGRLAEVAHGQPGAGADGGRERGPVAARAVDAVAGRAQVDEVGVDREQRVRIEAQSLDHAGAERDEHRVGVAHELVHDGAALVGVDVDGDALLALQHLHRAHLGERDDVADGVAVELLDLDDPGAEVGEQRRAVRRGEVRAELEHGDAGERWRVARVGRRLRRW